MNITAGIGAATLAALVVGCGGQQPTHLTGKATRLVAATTAASPSRCTTAGLAVRLGPAGHAAGSAYRPIRFTNTGSVSCTLRGYPGVSYVAPKTGRQVGAAASRDDAQKLRTVTLAPGGHAAALLQLVNYLAYPAGDCKARTVSGLRVYPPGSTTAAYVPFAHRTKACSTDVGQLMIRSVVAGRSGT